MKGHRHCYNENIEAHTFSGKDLSQALKRLGKWLTANGGSVYYVSFCDDEGDSLYAPYKNTPTSRTDAAHVQIQWQANA